MMKIWAKVILKEEKNAEYLIRSFFEDFNPENSIVIKGNEAKLEIIFNQTPPMKLIEAINHCKVIEFHFGKALIEYCEETQKQTAEPEETLEQTAEPEEAQKQTAEPEETQKQTAEPEETLEQTAEPEEAQKQTAEPEETLEQTAEPEETQKQTAEPEEAPEQTAESEEALEETAEYPKRKRGRAVVLEIVNIPVLEEIAKKATSFENFVKLVAEWLEMDKRQEFFINLVFVATEVMEMFWKELENALKNKSVSYSAWDKIWTGQQVSKKLYSYSATILPFLNTMVQYKDYSFGYKKSEENTEFETEVSIVSEESNASNNRVKMECMPEIPHFEAILGSVDKTQPIEERVRKMLNCMGLEDKPVQEQNEILGFVIQVFDGKESSMESRIKFSTFLNNFVGKYDPNKKVKAFKFLQQLQAIVV